MKQVNAEVLTIGDEILYGQIVDTNAQWISEQLNLAGIKTIRRTTIGDVREDILSAFSEAENRADLIVITGGLGPTADDLTKPLLAEYFDVQLVLNEEALNEVKEFFESRGRELTELNRRQAELPESCVKITNRLGTAPGMWLEKGKKVFVSMPGVPLEMKTMMTESIIPKLHEHFHTPTIYHKMIRTTGIGESFLSEEIAQWENNLPPNIKLAYLPSLGHVKLRLTAIGEERSVLEREVANQIDQLQSLAGKYIYGYDKEELQEAVGKLLKERNLTISTAESCTGGYLAHLITQIPGSSNYYKGTVVSYSNEVKVDSLSVNSATLDKHGAVSEETALQMAEGVRRKIGSSIGLATTGVAGPDGGTKEKPVGTAWIAYSDGERKIARKLILTSERMPNIQLTAHIILNLLRIQLLKYY